MRKLLNYLKRPFIGEQTTERLAFQQYNGLAATGINGDAGFTVKGQIKPCTGAIVVPGPSHKLNDLAVTGNIGYSAGVEPLTDNRNI